MVCMAGTNKLCFYFNKDWLAFVRRTPEQELGNGWAEGGRDCCSVIWALSQQTRICIGKCVHYFRLALQPFCPRPGFQKRLATDSKLIS